MTGAEPSAAQPSPVARWVDYASVLQASGPPLLFGLRLWASVCLALYIAFWLELGNPSWAGTSAAVMCRPHLGASLRKGWFRVIGTIIGAVAIVVLSACFPQDRAPFLVGLALWGAGCALVATLLKNFAAYSAALAGYTAAIVASDQLGATGGPNGQAFMLAVTRASEICIGIVSAGVVLGLTDFGQARRRLAALFAAISSEIAGRFTGTLAVTGANFDDTQRVRRELARRVIALDPAIDEALGESSQLRYHSPVLQAAVDGLFAALSSWRAVSVHLRALSADQARQGADAVLQGIPEELRSAPGQGQPSRWIADPVGLRQICETAVRQLIGLPASSPSPQLLADQTAEALAGISHALNGVALLVADPAQSVPRRHSVRLRVADWLPALVNGGRAFVAVGAAALFWIVTEWPNGAAAISFTRDWRHPLCAPRRLRLHSGHWLRRGYHDRRCCRCDRRICGAAEFGDLCRFQPRDRALACSCQCRSEAAMAESAVYLHGGVFPGAARAHQSDDLRHTTILQFSVSDHRGIRRGRAFISLDTAAVTGISDAPVVGANVARSAPPRAESDPADARRLGGPCVWPTRGIAGRSPARAARADVGSASGRDGNHPASPHRLPQGSGIRAGCSARGVEARGDRGRDCSPRPAR